MVFDRNKSTRRFFFALTVIGVLALTVTSGVSRAEEGTAAKQGPAAQPGAAGGVKKKTPFPLPESHKGNWMEFHGASADVNVSGAGPRGEGCFVCHARADCIDCHNTRAPRDHTNTWRNLSHGFMASGNRERCLTCHKQDYCFRCHNETAPRNHVGNWATLHCSVCHFEGALPGGSCGVCHKRPPH